MTPTQREAKRARDNARYASMTPEQREAYLEARRASMTPEQREAKRARDNARRANMTPEQHEAYLEAQRARDANMTPEQREAKRARDNARRANMTPEQREAYLEAQRARRASMTPEQHEEYLEAQRARGNARRANMTPEQRRADSLEQHFGITLDEYLATLDAIGFACQVCRAPLRAYEGDGREGFTAYVDHSHDISCKRRERADKGAIRSFVCPRCNTVYLAAADNPENTTQAILIVARHRIEVGLPLHWLHAAVLAHFEGGAS